MSDQATFIVRFILFAVTHSLFATAWAKRILRGSDRQGYRLCYNLASLGMFGWVMSAYRNSDVLYVAHGVWSLIMYLLQLFVVMILVSCLRQTGTMEFLGLVKPVSRTFTSCGWYSITRHPLYFFSILFMSLNPVMTSQWLTLTVMAATYFVIGGLIEERRLLVEFGDDYRHYRRRVPFFIPDLASIKSSTTAREHPIPQRR
ncbi:MAG: isoprenylcysteine carboxylmethyltransferase family protein [Desulfuromonadaceae bacterium]|nr:isoprenylcysteine carboxylmethyltransferase family protein [Desulfuromonadaceae bacterium]